MRAQLTAGLAALIVVAGGGTLIATADAPANACDSVSTSAIDTIAELKAYEDCRFDRLERKLDQHTSPSPSPSVTTTPSATPTASVAPTRTPSPTPTASATTSAPPVTGQERPAGAAANIAGMDQRVFTDEFSGTALDESRWENMRTNMNNVQTSPANVSVGGGLLTLTLSNASTGAEIDSAPYDGAGENGYLLQRGDYTEARVFFPGDSAGAYNWPAWWASGPNWPNSGEIDIAEVLGGRITSNYHGPSNDINGGAIPGSGPNAWHVYGAHRKAGSVDIYFDGTRVKTLPTSDSGSNGQALLLNVGVGQGSKTVTGAAGAVKVDYVRAWR